MRDAPQVVDREAALSGRADGLPLEQVIGAGLAAGRGHAPVRLDDATTAAQDEERSHGLAAGQPGEEQPRGIPGGEGSVDVAIGRLRPMDEARPPGRLDVDAVEVGDALLAGLDDDHPVAPRLVDVLAPLRAEITPDLHLGTLEVDDPRPGILDRARPPPAAALERRFQPLPRRHLGLDGHVAQAPTSRRSRGRAAVQAARPACESGWPTGPRGA